MDSYLEMLGVSELIQWIKNSATSLLFEDFSLQPWLAVDVESLLLREGKCLYRNGSFVESLTDHKGTRAVVSRGCDGVELFLFRGFPVLIFSMRDSNSTTHLLRIPRYVFNVRALIQEAIDRSSLSLKEIALVFNGGDALKGYGVAIPNDLLREIYLETAQRECFFEIERWISLKDWYITVGIPHTRGYLLHGKPGTGKSSFVRMVASWFSINVYTFDLAGMSNTQFKDRWNDNRETSTSIILIEDIDAVFHGRENISGGCEHPLTWDCFINTIAGVIRKNRVLLFITTNHPEHLDPSLASMVNGEIVVRPGRIDKAIEFKTLSKEARQWTVGVILKLFEEDAQPLVSRGEGMTGAQFTELCVQEALRGVWGAK